MLSRLMNRKNIGTVLVLVGFVLVIGLAGSSDIGSIPFPKAVIGAIGSLVLMGAGAVLLGGAADESSL